MLLGTYPAKFVAGHRIAVPIILRRDLGEKFILARWYEGCLVLIDINRWQDLYKRLGGENNLIITPIRDTERFILASAFEVIPDDQVRAINNNINQFKNKNLNLTLRKMSEYMRIADLFYKVRPLEGNEYINKVEDMSVQIGQKVDG